MNGNTGFIGCQGCRQARCHQAQQCMGWPTSQDANSASLRDQFAMAAIGGLVQRRWEDESGKVPSDIHERWARAAYATADAMLAERSK